MSNTLTHFCIVASYDLLELFKIKNWAAIMGCKAYFAILKRDFGFQAKIEETNITWAQATCHSRDHGPYSSCMEKHIVNLLGWLLWINEMKQRPRQQKSSGPTSLCFMGPNNRASFHLHSLWLNCIFIICTEWIQFHDQKEKKESIQFIQFGLIIWWQKKKRI